MNERKKLRLKRGLSFFLIVSVLIFLGTPQMHAEEEKGALDDLSLPTDLSDSNASPQVPTESPSSVQETTKPEINLEMSEVDQPSSNSVPVGAQNEITNLEFKMEGASSRILISSRYKLNYREAKNSGMKQVVYFFENTTTQQRLERAYDTTEFVSPVALFTLLQVPKSTPPQTKLIIQLREDKFPTLTSTDRGVYLEFPAPDYRQEPKLLTSDESRGSSEENIYSGNQTFSGNRIKRLEIKNSDVQDVLRLVAKSSGYNIVIGDDVQGKVGTLSIENLPWDQVFTLILQSKKLSYIRQGNVLRVGTLTSLKAEKEEALATEQSKMRVETLRTVVVPISYAKSADMAVRAKSFLSERGSAEADVRSNTVIIKDIDKNVVRIQKLFSVLDSQPPKVSIAAKFVEMSDSITRNLGFSTHNFGVHLGGLNLDPALSYSSAGNSTVLIRAADFGNLTSTLLLGEEDKKAKVIASPSLTINSNSKGSFTHSTTQNFRVVTMVNGVAAPEIRPITANIVLDITPIVAGDGSISMDVKLQNEVLDPTPDLPNLNSRKVETTVLVENGDTIVIGGVFKDAVLENKAGDPFIMNVPILGFLFSHSHKELQRSEILVFLTPKVLNVEEAFKRNF